VASPFIGTDAFQEVDVLGLSLACTKHSFLVQSLEELPRVMAEAFDVANSGRPGPVLVDIPKDIQVASASWSRISPPLKDDAFRMRKLKRRVRCWRKRKSRCCTSVVA
jgi:acetolactate synthase-1/2/3 large subunit